MMVRRALLVGCLVFFAAFITACKSDCERVAERLCRSLDISDPAALEKCIATNAYDCEISCVGPQASQIP